MTRATMWVAAISLPMLPMLLMSGMERNPAAAPDATPQSTPHAEIILEPTSQGCRVTTYVKNESRSDIWLRSEESRVRAKVWTPAGRKWAPWKQPLPMSNRRIRAGRTASMTMELTFGCNTPKQYQFKFKRGSDSAWKTVGGTNGTTNVRLVLGDAARLFT